MDLSQYLELELKSPRTPENRELSRSPSPAPAPAVEAEGAGTQPAPAEPPPARSSPKQAAGEAAADAPRASNVIGVFGLHPETREKDIERVFGAFGPIKSCVVIIDRNTGNSRGFGFVTFAAQADAKKAVEGTAELVMMGRSVRVDYSRTDSGFERTPGRYLGARREQRSSSHHSAGYSQHPSAYSQESSYRRPEYAPRRDDYRRDDYRRDYDRGRAGPGPRYAAPPREYSRPDYDARRYEPPRAPMHPQQHPRYDYDRYEQPYRGRSRSPVYYR